MAKTDGDGRALLCPLWAVLATGACGACAVVEFVAASVLPPAFLETVCMALAAAAAVLVYLFFVGRMFWNLGRLWNLERELEVPK
jgi:hypothetical protein